jgi:hypothetical protein
MSIAGEGAIGPRSPAGSKRQHALHAKLATIAAMDRAALMTEWQRMAGTAASKYLSTPFMRKALAYEAQCKALGGLPVSMRRALAAVAAGKSVDQAVRPSIQPGSHLVREWNGRTYQVEVRKDGYVLDGSTYKSLSAIARKITGVRWSGPRFFGLTDRRSVPKGADVASLQQQDNPPPIDDPDKAPCPVKSQLEALS